MSRFTDIFKGEYRKFAWFVVISTTIFLVLWIVGPGNTIVHWVKAKNEISRQEKQMKYYQEQIDIMDRDIEELKTNKDSLEKFARERFNFAAPGEDVYVVN